MCGRTRTRYADRVVPNPLPARRAKLLVIAPDRAAA
jgi:hypothetical protein